MTFKLLYFSAPWCAPCKMIAPMVEQLVKDNEGKFDFEKCDVSESTEKATTFGIRAIPAFVITANDHFVTAKIGQTDRADLQNWLDRNIN